MSRHHLKIWSRFFDDIASGKKQYEIRVDDRGYHVGDTLLLKEFDPDKGTYSGRWIEVLVKHITGGNERPHLIPADIVVMGIERLHGPSIDPEMEKK